MRNAVIWFIEERCFIGKVKPPEENGLLSSYLTFAVFTY